MIVSPPLRGLLALLCALLGSQVVAASVDNGRRLYEEQCVVCHGTPPNQLIRPSVVIGTNSASNIGSAIRSQVQMTFLSSLLTTADLEDIAIYLGKPQTTDADRLLDWGEASFASLLSPKAKSAQFDGFTYRAYAAGVFVGIKNGRVFLLDSRASPTPQDLGAVSSFLGQAEAAGF